MQVLERTVRGAVLTYANSLGVRHYKMNGPGNRGKPDDVLWIPGGRPLIIEFKRPGGKTTPKQDYEIKLLKEAGYDVQIIDNVADGRRAIERALESAGIPKESDKVPVKNAAKRPVPRSRSR